MTTQYVMANIQIPIEIMDNESFELMPEYISIQIENCSYLPEKKNLTNVQNTLLEQIKEAIEKKRIEDEKIILPSERPIKKRPQNITFKRQKQTHSRNTMRHYESDTDSSELLETESDSDEASETESEEDDEEINKQVSNPLKQEDKQLSNPLKREDMDADSSQLQEVQELEPANGLSYLNLKEDEYQD